MRAFRKRSSIRAGDYFLFGCKGGMWGLIVLFFIKCLSFYFLNDTALKSFNQQNI